MSKRKKSKPVPHTIYAISMTLNGKIATMNYRKRTSFRRTFRGSCLILSGNTVSFLISFILVGRYHLILAITTAVLVLPKYFFDVFADKKQRAFNINISGDQRRMKYYGDALQNSDILLEAKLNNAEDYFTNQYLCLSRKLNARIGLHKAKYGLFALLMDLIANLSFFAVILLTVLDALSGKISIGSVQYSWSLAENLKNRFAAMLHNISKLKSDRDSMVLLSEFVEENTAIETSTGDVCPQDDLVIEFEHVAFAYPGTDKNVLNDVNFIDSFRR